MIKLAFYDDAFCIRGTTKAILDYSKALYKYHGIKSSIFANYSSPSFSKTLFREESLDGLVAINLVGGPGEVFTNPSLDHEYIYHISGGANKRELNFLSESRYPILLHQVGYEMPRITSSHLINSLTKAAYASFWQSIYFSGGTAPVIPHIVVESEIDAQSRCLREELGIPKDSIVIGRHGGHDTWNLQFVNISILRAIERRPDLFFLFLNTPSFASHPQLKFLPGTSSRPFLESYISACDAMIHARWEGETFGLACAEFLVRSKPIITWTECRERNHFILADASIICYDNMNCLTNILLEVDVAYLHHKSSLIPKLLKARLSPKNVSNIFKNVFLS